MIPRLDQSGDHPAQHGNDPVLPVERRARRPGMPIVLGLLGATVACALFAFGGLLGAADAWLPRIAFFVFLGLFVAGVGRADHPNRPGPPPVSRAGVPVGRVSIKRGSMSHLDKLTITRRVLKPRPSRHRKPSLEHYRDKLIANLEEQIELARKTIAGEPAVIKRRRGSEVRAVRPRLWWSEGEDGHVGSYILYNRTALALKGRGRTIEVGRLRNLPGVYRTVIAAARAGELDTALIAAARGNNVNWKA